MRRALEAVRRGDGTPAFSTWAEGSRGSGGAVRLVAVACAYHDDSDGLVALAEETAAITHAHPIARAGAVLHAIAIGCALAGRDLESIATRAGAHGVVADALGEKIARVRSLVAAAADGPTAVSALGNGVVADEAVPLALFCFARWAPDGSSTGLPGRCVSRRHRARTSHSCLTS